MNLKVNRVALISEMARQDIRCCELTEKAGLSRSTITEMRSGRTCRLTSINRVARALGVPVESLIENSAWRT